MAGDRVQCGLAVCVCVLFAFIVVVVEVVFDDVRSVSRKTLHFSDNNTTQ